MSSGRNIADGLLGKATAAVGAGLSRREDGDDLFAHTRMSLGDHIEELRRHMIKALIGFFIAMIAGFFVSEYVLDYIKAPIEAGMVDLYNKRLKKTIDTQDELDVKVKNLINA